MAPGAPRQRVLRSSGITQKHSQHEKRTNDNLCYILCNLPYILVVILIVDIRVRFPEKPLIWNGSISIIVMSQLLFAAAISVIPTEPPRSCREVFSSGNLAFVRS